YLSTGTSYRALSFSFRMAHNTIGKIIYETCNAIWEVFSNIHMHVQMKFLDGRRQNFNFCKSNILNISLNSIEYLKEHNSGPLLDECTGPQFKIVIKNNIKTKIKFLSDCYIGFTYNGSLSIFKIVNIRIKKSDKSKVFIAKQFNHIQPFYKTPINSLKLGIGTVNEFYEPLITIDIEKNGYSKYLILNNTKKVGIYDLYIIYYYLTDTVKCQSKFMNVSQNELESRIKYHLAQAPFNIKKNNKLGLKATD
ncbi:Uncharacterized protein FWK35_00035450, partial [Aphis craccivora]